MTKQKKVTQSLPMIIVASSTGMLVEWYDFYIFGSLAYIIATKFFPPENPALALISTLATFAVGFVVRPFGALVFGRVGDVIGRKRTFIITLLIMGVSTVLVGLIPEYKTIGIMAPIIILILRLLQGLALGGEYGGAASFVAEHAPSHKRGYLTSWIQTTAAGGIFFSLLVISLIRHAMTKEAFEDWGWRIPFLISAILVIISYYIRKRMDESPMFAKLKEEGQTSKNPLKDSFGNKYNLKFVLLALLGATMGAGVIFYTNQFYPLQFMKITMGVDADQTENILSWGLILGIPFFVIFGKLSD
ncbi:MAG: MFS transporter, partial [Chitinophagaceae bacterium]